MKVIDTGEGVLLKPEVSFFKLAGSGAGKATVKEIKQLLDKLREEDA